MELFSLLLCNSELHCGIVESLWTFKSDGPGFNWQCLLTVLCHLGKSLNLSVHLFSHMQDGNNNEIRNAKYQIGRSIC